MTEKEEEIDDSEIIEDILWHPSDLSVRPVMPSRKSNKGSDAVPSLSFDAPRLSDFVKMSKEQLDSFNSRIISIISGNTPSGEKQNVIRYLELLSSNADVACILTNGSIGLVLVKMLRHSKVFVACSTCFTYWLRQARESEKVLKWLLWANYYFKYLVKMSILGIINQWNLHLRTADPHPVGRAPGKQEIMRLTAGSCLARLVRFSPCSIQRVMEKFSFKDMVPSCLRQILIEQGSEVLKGKGTHIFCSGKRLVKEKDDFVKQCLDALGMVVASTVPSLLECISGDIQHIRVLRMMLTNKWLKVTMLAHVLGHMMEKCKFNKRKHMKQLLKWRTNSFVIIYYAIL
ncbi:hypothetical protein H5410_051060 [Solanum commersonii]|uniref:Uncharacterized protein n=1 Tax=Solanum commersonii TaxID=4109 RepID=A0A9J5WX59_SOLCO|nr:hypothetical protein H5410_051060 [Solanum commersonii]